jgi:hypothetical protein
MPNIDRFWIIAASSGNFEVVVLLDAETAEDMGIDVNHIEEPEVRQQVSEAFLPPGYTVSAIVTVDIVAGESWLLPFGTALKPEL